MAARPCRGASRAMANSRRRIARDHGAEADNGGVMASDLDRFVDAQAGVYGGVLEELRRGRKTGHWIWFVFPQIAGLGRSPMSRMYAITSVEEARAYLEHPLLGRRLRESAEMLLATAPG